MDDLSAETLRPAYKGLRRRAEKAERERDAALDAEATANRHREHWEDKAGELARERDEARAGLKQQMLSTLDSVPSEGMESNAAIGRGDSRHPGPLTSASPRWRGRWTGTPTRATTTTERR